MKLQEIFDYLIDSGLYSGFFSGKPTISGYAYMCIAIDKAEDLERLSAKDAAKARGAIRTYLNALHSASKEEEDRILYWGLINAGLTPGKQLRKLPHSDMRKEWLLSIYRNWAKRPYPPKVKAKAKAKKGIE